MVLNLDASTLGDWLAASPGLGKIVGDGDPSDLNGDLDGDGSQGERRATPGLACCILGPGPTGGFGAPGPDGGHKGR